MPTSAVTELRGGAFTTLTDAAPGEASKRKLFRVFVDHADTESTVFNVGAAKAIHITVGTVTETIVGTNVIATLQYGNPGTDGSTPVYQDTTTAITVAASTTTADAVTVFDPAATLRFSIGGTSTAGKFYLWVEAAY
jgi:hypothetical protein